MRTNQEIQDANFYIENKSEFEQVQEIIKLSSDLENNQNVVITLGAKGALVASQNEKIQVEGRPVKAVDTNGAGDAFAGAFLYAIHQGSSLEQAAELAVLISSEVVAQFGPRLAIEKYARLQQNIEMDLA